MPPPSQNLTPNQFGDAELSTAEAYAACGPAAAVGFARANGRNPTLKEALELAKAVGWTPGQGMPGPGAQKALLDKMGVASRLENDANWERVRADAEAGNPVIISTPGHYFVVAGFDPETGAYDVGTSGTAYKGGNAWLTPRQMEQLAGRPNGVLYVDNPAPNTQPTTGDTTMRESPAALNPRIIKKVKDEPAKKFGIESQVERQRTVTLMDGTTYTFYYGKDSPPASPEQVEGTEFRQENFSGLRLGSIGVDNAQRTDWEQMNKAPAAPSLRTEKVTQPDGSVVYFNVDPKTGERSVALDNNGNPIIGQAPGRAGRAGRTASQTAADDARAEASRAAADLARVRAAAGGFAPRTASQTEADLALAEERRAQTIKAEVEAAAAAQRMLPEQMLAIQQSLRTINYIRDEAAAGHFNSPDDPDGTKTATAYLAANAQALESALRGSTPAKEEAARQLQTTRRAEIGKDILNQRLQSGTVLAGNLFKDYQTLLSSRAAHGLPTVAPPEGLDLFSYARALTDELGGGPEMSQLAKQLLAATNPATGPAVGPSAVPVMAGAGTGYEERYGSPLSVDEQIAAYEAALGQGGEENPE